MKKETIIWQVVVLILGLFLIFVIKTYLENEIILGAMRIESDTMAKRASCFATVQEKDLNDAYCKDIDTTAYKILGTEYRRTTIQGF